MDVSKPPASRLTPRGYVPPNAKQETVSAADTWITVAARVGMMPWQLIQFNYPGLPVADLQLAAREVNWYLQNYLGCTRSTDGRNYAFSAGMKVWVPRGVVAVTPPTPPTPDELAKQRVLAALGDPVMQRMLFSVGTFIWIRPSDYAGVAQAIRGGKITVKANASFGSNAAYHPDSNVIEINPASASDGLIVHECTHAIFDIRKATLILAQNEGAAYIAQHMYELLKTGTIHRNVVSWAGHPDWLSPLSWQGIFDESARLAKLAKRNPFLSDQEVDPLFSFINGANFYQGRANEVQTRDGI